MNKTVLVTGATRGLGLEIARLAARDGYTVIAVGRHLSDELAELIAAAESRVLFEAFDFSRIADIRQWASSICKQYGRPWGLVNNAAIGTDGVLATMHEKDIGQVLQVNLEAPIVLSKYLSRPMLLNGAGRIINVSSIMADTGFSGLSVYGATKAGLIGFTKALSRELGKAGITVNALCPGYMETDMTAGLQGDKLSAIKRRSPSGQLATTTDAAELACFLLSEKSAGINGAKFTVDAGSTA